MPAENDADLSRRARPTMTAAKHQLRDWIEAELARGYRDNIDADAFAAHINGRLKAAGVRVRAVQAWSDNGVLIVVTSFEIVCGSDDSIYGWSWDGKAWRRVIDHEITDYTPERYQPETVYGPGAVYFAPIGPRERSRDYVFVKAVDTWCTSGWQPIRFQLYDVDKPAAKARLLIDDMVSAHTLDDAGMASLSSDSMAIVFRGQNPDPRKNPFGPKAVLFTLDEGKANRVPFGAADAEDFTEQWLDAPWTQSSAVSAPGNKPKNGSWQTCRRWADGGFSGI